MNNLGAMFNLLSMSEALIERSAARIPGYEAPQPFNIDLTAMRQRQALLDMRLRQIKLEMEQAPGNLGAAMVVATLIGGGVLGLSAIGGWIYSHFTDAKAMDNQTGLYQDLRQQGTDAETAARISFGSPTDWGSFMNKLIILSIIGAGVFLVVKLT